MALLKTKTLDNGTEGNYWKIVRINTYYPLKQSEVLLGLYLNQEIREQGKPVLEIKTFSLNIPDLNGDLRAQAYTLIEESKLDTQGKETNFFVDAVDC